SAGSLYFDFAKDHLTEETLTLLCGLAHTANLTGAIDNLFGGETVNNTENRPALHVALRSN
ncbi:MAG TPA: glucose-6-phosphate isomerase, partial [Porticoccaceae bacterium]|nr:glucose-6-phosphate isomerase [Porticoccaceae bacterium]